MGGDSRSLPPLLTVKPCDGFLRSSKYVEGITGDLMKFARRSLAIVAISTLAALAAACGSDDSTEDVLLVALNEMNGSGQSGYAMLVADDDQTDVSLSLSTGTLQSELVHIHSGSCDELGGVEHGLTNFAGGSGGSETKVAVELSTLTSGAFAVNAHEVDNAGNYTACGDVPASADATTFALKALDGSGQDGFATLIRLGGSTVVVADISQGSLSSEKVHIHSGQCGDDLGGVDYGLTDFAGGSGA